MTAEIGSLDQGTIFSCGLAEDYTACEVYGLVITARCDIAQDKAPVLNYLPVVKLDDWLHRDGRQIFSERVRRDYLGRMRNFLSSNGHSESILEVETPQNILATIFPEGGDQNNGKRKMFADYVTKYGLAEICINSAPGDCKLSELASDFSRPLTNMCRELVDCSMTGYYFLKDIEPGGASPGYVALLREVRHIPRKLSSLIAQGLSKDEFVIQEKDSPLFSACLSFDVNEFAMPIGQMQSPNVEHVLQSFSMLFGRIGVDDIDKSYKEGIWKRQPSIGME